MYSIRQGERGGVPVEKVSVKWCMAPSSVKLHAAQHFNNLYLRNKQS